MIRSFFCRVVSEKLACCIHSYVSYIFTHLLLGSSLPLCPAPCLAAMASFRRVHQHLQGVQKLLASLRGQPCLESVAASQAKSVTEGLRGVSLSSEQAAALNSLIIDGDSWPAKLASELIQLIATSTSACPTTTSAARMKQQDFQAITEYFSMSQWHLFSDRSVVEDTKLDVMLDLCLSLGLRCPSEHTFQMLTMLWRLAVSGPEQLDGLAWSAKLDYLHHVKRVFKRKASRVVSPAHFILELPPLPATFKADHPDVYREVFAHSEPTKCPIPLPILKGYQDRFPCRSTRQAPVSQQVAANTDMQAMVGMMSQMLQMLSRGPSSSSSSSNDDIRIEFLNPTRGAQSALSAPNSSSTISVPVPPVVAPSLVAPVAVAPAIDGDLPIVVVPKAKGKGKND